MESVHIACQNLPTLSAWTGESHDAGTAAFRRANNTATAVASFAASVGSALCTGAYTLGKARTDLLVKADAVDAGRLWVTDAWVVLIDPIELTLEEADGLAEEANRHQGEVNRLLLAVDAADDSVAQAIQSAAGKHGWTNPVANTFVPIPGLAAPTDQVPNPGTLFGIQQQLTVRAEDMAITVRATETFEDDQGRHKVLYMQDDSSGDHRMESVSGVDAIDEALRNDCEALRPRRRGDLDCVLVGGPQRHQAIVDHVG